MRWMWSVLGKKKLEKKNSAKLEKHSTNRFPNENLINLLFKKALTECGSYQRQAMEEVAETETIVTPIYRQAHTVHCIHSLKANSSHA